MTCLDFSLSPLWVYGIKVPLEEKLWEKGELAGLE